MADTQRLSDRLCAALKAIERIEKRGHNDKFNYDFATESDIADGVRAALSDQGIALQVAVVSVEMRELGKTSSGSVMWLTTAKMELSLRAGDECWTSAFYGTGTDTGDKGLYKAITGGVKYFLLKTLLIPTGDDPEREQEPVKAAAPRQTVAPKPAASKPTPKPVDIGTLEGPFGITRIYSCEPDKRRPGKVVFDDGIEATTFSESDIAMAKQLKNTSVLRGLERVEKNGKVYVNLAAIAPYHEMDAPTPDDEEPLPF